MLSSSIERPLYDYSQVRLPQFFYPNEISQPPHERMTKLEAALIEMKRVHAECVTSQVQFMELTRANVQIQHTPFDSSKKRWLQWPLLVLNLHLRKNNLKKRRV